MVIVSSLIIAIWYDRSLLYTIGAGLGTFLAIKTAFFLSKRRKRFKLLRDLGYDGPEVSIFSGNIRAYKGFDARYLVDEGWRQKYGKAYCYFIGDDPSIVFTDLDVLKEVFVNRQADFTERSFKIMESTFTDGILMASHDRWKLMRKAMAPAFSRFTMRGDTASQFIEDSIKQMTNYIDHLAKSGTQVDIQDLMKAAALNLIVNLGNLLEDRVEVKENEPNVQVLNEYLSRSDSILVNLLIMFPILKPPLQFIARHFGRSRLLGSIHKRLENRIDSSKGVTNQLNGDKVMDTLIKMHHQNRLTRKEVIGNADSLLIAGYETTSTTLTYAFWILSKHLDVQHKLRDELKVYGINSEYLDQVLNETMRLYPTVMTFTTRVATKTVKINQYVVPQGTRVVYNSWLLYRNPDIWPNPNQFDPSRFSAEERAKHHPCAFAPFGLGDRKCLGYQLALLEMKMVICDMLLRYKLKLVSPNELDIVTSAFVMTKPKDKVVIEFERLVES